MTYDEYVRRLEALNEQFEREEAEEEKNDRELRVSDRHAV